MKHFILTALIVGLSAVSPSVVHTSSGAQVEIVDAATVDMARFRWVARPLVVFADTADSPALQAQMARLIDRTPDLIDRNIIVIRDTTPRPASPLRQSLQPDGFTIVLVGKDGGVKWRATAPTPFDVIAGVIDQMPMRQREMREGK